ncbi:facilitated trehalose transporter Tret1-like [Contarinia nasturtii]|uniref:facilitated trehalose transporter Tret1-like n=1 Tax=Contarinia nasturtii TaxID=265458 RepID=UPI0012D3B878|nr:facilitated trehalose transporter Tret1-like [Contarinia nasturtii]
MTFNLLDIFSCGLFFDFGNAPSKVSAFRRILPQFLCGFAHFLINWNMGMVLAIASIVVPSVIGISKHLNPDEILHMTWDEASWLASIIYIVQPIGNFASGFIAESLGRKGAIMTVNVIPAIAWIMLPNANTQFMIYIGFSLLGIWNGLISAAHIYSSEISEPSVRGVLNAFSGIAATAGILMIFLLGSFLSWRQVSYACAIIPIFNVLVAIFIPDSPIFLVSNNRTEKAQKSLQVLRGWVAKENVLSELEQLKNISEMSSSCGNCEKSGNKCDHPPPNLLNKLKDNCRRRTLKPLLIVTILFLLMQFSGMFAMRPFLLPILNAHGIFLDASFTTIILGVIGIMANIFIVFTIRTFGKRKIYLFSMIGNAISCFGLSIYGWILFPAGWTSVGMTSSSLKLIQETVGTYNYFALAMFLLMQFCISVGVSSIPFIIMCEVFPFKSRAFCCSLAMVESQFFAFVATKTYYDFERLLTLPGVIGFYGVIAVFGFIAMALVLPETEHCSLEEIELHFSDNKRGICDIKIKK